MTDEVVEIVVVQQGGSREFVVVEPGQDSSRREVVVVEKGPTLYSTLDPSLTGYVKGNGAGVWTASAFVPWADLSGKPTTVGGYGITDAYTKTQVDALLAGYEPLDPDLAAIAALGTTGYLKRTGSNTWALSAGVPWSDITSTPTTLAGYGITNAYTKTEVDSLLAGVTVTLDPDLTAIAALTGTGYAARTGTNAWTLKTTVPWSDISSTPTTLDGYGITDAYTKTVADARYAPIAVPWASIIGSPTTLAGYGITDAQALDSDLTALAGMSSTGIPVQTAVGSWAQRSIVGGSNVTVTNGSGVSGNPSIAVTALDNAPIGATTPSTGAFTTLSATGAGTLPGSGGWLGTGELGVRASASTSVSITVAAPSGTATTTYGTRAVETAPTTSTTAVIAYGAAMTTANTAVVYTSVNLFHAETLTRGAASTVTNVRGFYAASGIAQGTNNYGFYCDFNSATTTWAFYGAGTANSYLAGPLGIGPAASDPLGAATFLYLGNGTHPSTAANITAINMTYTGPATATNIVAGMQTSLSSTNASYTLASMIHYFASSSTKGASNTLTGVYGFRCSNNIAVGANNFAFYTDINVATNTWAYYCAGTAPSLFGGAVIEKEITVTYSASMTIDARTGNEQVITATNGTAFTINQPSNPNAGQYLEITIRNTSGGALGTATWAAVFKMTTWTQPATGFSRTIIFRYNGTNWVEKGRTAADVPN